MAVVLGEEGRGEEEQWRVHNDLIRFECVSATGIEMKKRKKETNLSTSYWMTICCFALLCFY